MKKTSSFRMFILLAALGLCAFTTPSHAITAPPSAAMPQSFADLVEKYSPAVVNVSIVIEPETMQNGQNGPSGKGGNRAPHRRMPSPFEGTPFEDLFKDFMEQMPLQQIPESAVGSGVIISADGYIITNAHVVDGANEVTVRMKDEKKEYKAKVIGADKKTDVALVKIKPEKALPFAPLGNSATLRVGDWVMAIGNPFGLGGSVSAGIVSALGRNIGQGPYDDFIQTDAAINPGNSGGPLFNTKGEVVGINTAILTRSGGSQGIGFAVPSDTVKLVVTQLKSSGHVTRGWLGVKIQTVTPEIADALGLKENSGALVAGITKNSPAGRAGVKTGDLITRFNGHTINSVTDLPKLVANTAINKVVPVEFLRNGKRYVAQVRINALKDDEVEKASLENGGGDVQSRALPKNIVLGMDVRTLTPTLRQQAGVTPDVQGVLVMSVTPGSMAFRGNIRAGDVIVQANGKKITTPADLKAQVAASKGKAVLLLVNREGENLFVALKPKVE